MTENYNIMRFRKEVSPRSIGSEKNKQDTVRISRGIVEAIRKFLETPAAKEAGLDSISDVTTEAVRQLLRDYGYYKRTEEPTPAPPDNIHKR